MKLNQPLSQHDPDMYELVEVCATPSQLRAIAPVLVLRALRVFCHGPVHAFTICSCIVPVMRRSWKIVRWSQGHALVDPEGRVARCWVPPPLAHARPCLSTGWALNLRFEEILAPLFLWSRMEDWVFVECLYRERGAQSCL